jgi:hypothetical protein
VVTLRTDSAIFDMVPPACSTSKLPAPRTISYGCCEQGCRLPAVSLGGGKRPASMSIIHRGTGGANWVWAFLFAGSQ